MFAFDRPCLAYSNSSNTNRQHVKQKPKAIKVKEKVNEVDLYSAFIEVP